MKTVEDRLLKPAEVAPILRVAPGTLANWRSRGVGPAWTKAEHGVRYRESAIHAYLTANELAA